MLTLLDRGRRAGGRATLGAILLACAVMLLALPASAHDSLTGSSPAEGEVLEEVPSALQLTFSGEISDLGVQFMVTGPEGRDVVQGTPTVEGTEVTQELAEELVDGDYEAAWRVTSSDGHPISGTITFTIAAGTAPGGDATGPEATGSDATGPDATGTSAGPGGGDATADDQADGTTDSPSATPAPTGDTTTDAAEATQDAAQVSDPEESSQQIPTWGWLVAGLAAVGLVACGFLAFRRN